MAARAVPRRTRSMGGFWGRNRGSIAEICRKHHHHRRNDAEREKRVQRRQDATQVARRADGKPPRDHASGETRQCRDRARPGRDLQSCAALRTLDIVRACRRFRRRNFRLAMRTHANSHRSPPDANAYNNRIGAPMKRGDERRDRKGRLDREAAPQFIGAQTLQSYYLRLRQSILSKYAARRTGR